MLRQRPHSDTDPFLYQIHSDLVDDLDDEEEDTPIIKAEILYRNPVTTFLATLASLIFWLVYWSAKIFTVIAGIGLILGFIFPRYFGYAIFHLMDQYKTEKHFQHQEL